MEMELRNQLLATQSALQLVVGVLAKHAQAHNPDFRDEVIALLSAAAPNADAATTEAVHDATMNLLRAP